MKIAPLLLILTILISSHAEAWECRNTNNSYKDKIFLFPGLNVMRNQIDELDMNATPQLFVGNSDHWYDHIDARSFFVNHETLNT